MRATILVAAVAGAAFALPATTAAQTPPPALVTGADVGGGPHVLGWTATGGRLPISVMAFGGNNGGVRVATADVDGDGRPEILAAPGAAGSAVKILDGRDYTLRHRFTPYGTWGSGVYVAGADMTGDGRAEVVAATGPGCCTSARFYDPLTPRELSGFFLYDSQTVSGARIAAADFTGDGRAELAVVRASGTGTGRVSLYSMNGGGTPFRSFTAFPGDPESDLAAGDLSGGAAAEVVVSAVGQVRAFDVMTGAVLASLIPFSPQVERVGVAVGDVDGDGHNDIVTTGYSADGLQVKAFDLSGRTIASFFALDATLGAGTSVAAANLSGDSRAEIVLGSGPSFGEPHVAVFDAAGAPVGRVAHDERFFSGGVRVALGDVVGDDRLELVTAPGPGRPPEIRLYDHNFDALRNPVGSFVAFAESFAGGVYVAAADLVGDGRPEIVVAPGAGMEPRVKVFAGDGRELASFLAFEPDYRGGVRIAAGDVDADGKAEVVVGRASGAPQIRVLTARGEQRISIVPFAGDSGVEVGVADLAGDGRVEILVADSAGIGGVRILDSTDGSLVRSLAQPAGRATGVDVDGDGRDEIAIALLPSFGGVVNIVRGDGAWISSFSAYPGFRGGIFVAAMRRSGSALSIEGRTLRTSVGIPVREDVAIVTDGAGRTSTSGFAATVDWQDGNGAVPATIVALGGGRFAVRGLKTFAGSASYPVEVTVTEGGRKVHTTTTIHVGRAPLRTSRVNAVLPTGRAFNGVVARFRDRDLLSRTAQFSATVAWGDGRRSAAAVRRLGPGAFVVRGAHRYRRPGLYRVVVRVVDHVDGRRAVVRSTIRVR